MKRARWLLKVSPAPGTRGGGSGGVAEGERCGVLRSEVGAEEDSGGCGLRSGLRRSVVGGLRSDVELRWLWKEVAGTL